MPTVPQSIDFTLTFPGEGAVIAITHMIEVLAEGQSPEQRIQLWNRYIELTQPWHAIALEASKRTAELLTKLLQLDVKVTP